MFFGGSKLKLRIEELEKEFQTEKKKVEELSSEKVALKAQKDEVETEIQALKQKVSQLNQQLDQSKTDREFQLKTHQDLQQKYAQLQKTVQELELKNLKFLDADSKIKKAEDSAQKYKDEQDRLSLRLKQSESDLQGAQADLETLSQKHKELQDQYQKIKPELEKLKKLHEENQRLKEEVQKLKQKSLSDNSTVKAAPAPVEPKSPQGFTGKVDDITLFDLLQMLVNAHKNQIVNFKDRATAKDGQIYVRNGEIIHSEFAHLKGLQAFLLIMSSKHGSFSVSAWKEPTEETIQMPAANLFMEVARVMDEREAYLNNLEVPVGSIENMSEEEVLAAAKKIENTIQIGKSLVKSVAGNIVSDEPMKQAIQKILVVDDSATILSIIKKYLLSQGYTTSTCTSAKDGIALMQKEEFDLVITDLDMPEINGVEFFLWIKGNKPQTQVIMMTAFGSEDIREFANSVGILRYFEKPLNMKQVKQVLDEISEEHKVGGDITNVSLLDFIQMLVLSRKQKLVEVIDPITKTSGKIYLAFGEIVHAEYLDKLGEEAFYPLMAMKSGHFQELSWEEPAQKSIETSPMRLFMEAARRIDLEDMNLKNMAQIDDMFQSTLAETAVESKPELQKAKEEHDFTIYESGKVLNIQVGSSKKNEVLEILSAFTQNLNESAKMLVLKELTLSVIFESDLVSEINIGPRYPGATAKGLKMGDSMEKAVGLYGTPRLSSNRGVIWDSISVFSQDSETINTIRLA
ncbi:hypothetical protein COW36_21755 [bacterium (Candidatus Blackallbacteria) CG17_big_fil_post_rev_8_21_14_2_50_48_46]|uniref:Response regulatory domain-containing protein n=1 Tax=bacterium (Candidatus Blackallbacteria) CG17_big_fil_post_rev_8_21_14_2_50_48_46 TaxID=2014261 RepID=A0A2M7FZ63_9BACT|nr:MAG: hypothetical protein COW64_11105 [bacterium (Candidatus Blackallbacteria) CG18_big_fil_WC_8_21_14_2_50_49_26]PIW14395.1 MAG: hypothetical protein COW36_21755 [bacterium (Candidatus Blackallbacteria) CG17_big_fil_post_rev_8_21_14_2_50_48_46]PIW46902.1 MAG: hypothetical protein COW20_14170 [bacterium (Candidatus Blackallbacteria) CG13_big_fil_rev_8_21_14_2_50_49_14]